ncbi:calcineurin B-like protein 10 isoform X2 [Manihot esculenta]|uniref:calcineurin B-like protein 10 isoform X2 n=1 Tax=Manihot esculenta TaxID=3983 RepID=UPI000B5D928E|nr:calcineurin B-like protein 10 isoform X2 [Manihot esculenta]
MDSTRSSLEKSSSYFSPSERLCAVLKGIIETVIFNFLGCFNFHRLPPKPHYSFNDLDRIASTTLFSVNEVEALLDLFKKLSSSIVDDGLLHREELRLALLRTPASKNLFLDRLTLRNLLMHSTFFILVLLWRTKLTVRQMLNAIILESDLQLSEEYLEAIIDKTFADADIDEDGKINREEWKAFVVQNPTLLKHMTLPSLTDITTAFPSFIFSTEVDD